MIVLKFHKSGKTVPRCYSLTSYPWRRVTVKRMTEAGLCGSLTTSVQPGGDGVFTIEVEVNLDGAEHKLTAYPGQLLLEALEDAGLQPPYSCRAGACAACMCKLEEGEVEMLNNHVLDESDLAQNWILACQSVARTSRVKLKYPG